ncbi:MAG TPA: histidine kinase [Candidatus Saccharimonadales bacterium]|nr:histidine kinase [Candidatus Saccharimonadales bacterium]
MTIALATSGAIGFALLTTLVGAASGAPLDFLVLDLAMGLTFIVTGVVAWVRRPEVLTGPLLLLCGVLNFVGSYGPTDRPVLSTLGYAFQGYYDVVLAVLVLALPGRLPQGRSRSVAIALLAAFLVRSLSRLFLQDGPTMYPELCGACPSNPFVIATTPAAFETIEALSSALIAVLCLLVAAICLQRLLMARPLARRVLWPILVAGIAVMCVAALDAAETAAYTATGRLLLDVPEAWSGLVSWAFFGMRLLVPIGILVGSLRLRMSGGPLVALAVGLGRVPSPVRLESALGAALGDPAVRLIRRDPEGDGWLTADGRPTTEPTEDLEHGVTMLEHDGRPLAAIVHDPVLREDPALVGSVMAVLRLAVENERLDAALRSQLEEVRASRARLVQAGEDERRRLERDLHDGAQQRLVSVSLALQQARQTAETEGSPVLRDRLATATDELQAAIGELRELARGIHPALLEHEGLPAAVTGLARRSNLPVEVRVDVSRRLPRSVESAAYFTVAECLTNAARHARADRAMVRIVDEGERLVIDIEDDGVGGADPSRGSGLRGLADRLGALDGRLEVQSALAGGTRVRAEIPIP